MIRKRNPAWSRDELILALDVYFQVDAYKLTDISPEVIQLTKNLGSINEIMKKDYFRTPTSTRMKLQNFLRLDPNHALHSLPHGSKLEKQIWDEFSADHSYLHAVALSMIAECERSLNNVREQDIEIEQSFPEGRLLYQCHRIRERNSQLVLKVKKREMDQTGCLKCSCCGFDYAKTYGKHGENYIECHHVIPVCNYAENQITRESDLVLVCANCHRMIHYRRPWLSIDDLKSILTKQILINKNC